MASALNLLNEYSSSSSEDEAVPGPRVSTKRCTPKDWTDERLTKKILLPVPSVLTSLYVNSDSNIRHFDDPSQHDGRLRSYKHERGNWTTFVYIPYDGESHSSHLTALVNTIISECGETVPLKPIEDFHISLTKTVVLLHHWIDSFKESVQSGLIGFPKFTLLFDSLEIYTNDEKTRTFIGLRLAEVHSLLDLVAIMDKCLGEFKLPAFYKNPSFHLSFAWCVGDCESKMRELLPRAHAILDTFTSSHPALLQLQVKRLMCKSGNKRFVFNLEPNSMY